MLESILSKISIPLVGYIVLLIALYFSAITLWYRYFYRNREKEERKKRKFFETLMSALKSDDVLILDFDDVINIYKGIFGASPEDSKYKPSLSELLRELLVEIISKNKTITGGNIDGDNISTWKWKINEFIKENEEKSPFADLPSLEKNLLNDIFTFLKKKSYSIVEQKILELAGAIQGKDEQFNKIKNINKWTIPLTIIGVGLTILFGTIGLYLFFFK